MPELSFTDADLRAGVAATELIAQPASWIHRRVETVQLLTHEETRRQVSVDFTLSIDVEHDLSTADGVVIPISILTKEARRNFDLRNEAGAAVPVLGKAANGHLAHIAVLSAALDALPEDTSDDAFELIAGDLGQIVNSSPGEGEEALAVLAGGAQAGNPLRAAVWKDDLCREMLRVLSTNYVLFAVLPPGGARRRILKYSYSDDLERINVPWRERLRPSWIWLRARSPDRGRFFVRCPGADRAASFHAEIAIPEELRIETAVLYDFDADVQLSEANENVNRASLYASEPIDPHGDVNAYLEIVAERRGKPSLAASTAVAVCALLWLGVASGLDSENPGPAVSLLLAAAAVFSGLSAVNAEHSLVTQLFSKSKRWLALVAVAALAASASLAMEIPCSHPVGIWRIAAISVSFAAARLLWSAVRSAR